MTQRRYILLVAGLSTVLLSGCSVSTPTEEPRAVSLREAVSVHTEAQQNALRFASRIQGDYEQIVGTDALAELSEIVLQGRIAAIEEGPIYGRPDDDFSDIPTVVVKISEISLVQGSLPKDSDGNAYLVLVAPGGRDTFANGIPIGSRLALYGQQTFLEGKPGDVELVNISAGRPAGQPTFVTAHPQGLVVDVSADGSGQLVWPLTGAAERGSIEAALPGGPLDGREPATR